MSITTAYIIIGILLVLTGVMGFAIVNMYRKIDFYEEWYDAFAAEVEDIYQSMQEMDSIMYGAMENDDEVGYFFRQMKEMLTNLRKMGFYGEVEDEE